MSNSYVVVSKNSGVDHNNTKTTHHTYEEQPVRSQTIVVGEIFDKSLFAVIIIFVLAKAKKQNSYSSVIAPSDTSILDLSVPIIKTVETTSFFSSVYPVICTGMFCIALYFTLYRVLSPLSFAYNYFNNYFSDTKVFITTVKGKCSFVVSKITSILCFLWDPSISSGEDLKRAQDILFNKQETVKYFFKAAAIQKLAKEKGIYLTLNNNGSFKVFPNKSFTVDA